MSEQTDVVNNETHDAHEGDAFADAMAAVALIAIFVVTCVYWVSGQ